MQWHYDKTERTYTLSDITALELGTLVAAICAGFAVMPGNDPYGAEAARRNLLNYTGDLGMAETDHVLQLVIAADAHRIHGSRSR